MRGVKELSETGETEGVQSTPARRALRQAQGKLPRGRARRGKKKEVRGSSSKFKVQSSKFENAPEINQKTWNLELGTLNLIGLMAASLFKPSKAFCSLAYLIGNIRCLFSHYLLRITITFSGSPMTVAC